jgi:signal transduction histidine kinase/DNA-binding response OmpR family regulator/streptogramin lyase
LFITLIFATVLRAATGDAQVFSMRPITVDDGLSQSHVTEFAQDNRGFVWVGTAVGLNRYDGHAFTVYRHDSDNPASLSGDSIYSLHVDRKGSVWVGTDQGLDRYIPSTDSFQRFLITDPHRRSHVSRTRAIDSDPSGIVWATSQNPSSSRECLLSRADPASGKTESFLVPLPTPGKAVIVRLLSRGEALLVVRETGNASQPGFVVLRVNLETRLVHAVARPEARRPVRLPLDERDLSIAYDGKGFVWIGSLGSVVHRLDLRTNQFSTVEVDRRQKDPAGADLVTTVVQGPGGDIWVLSSWNTPSRRSPENRAFRFNGAVANPTEFRLRTSGACDFDRSRIISSQIDRSGVLWAGLSGAGICVADLNSGMFSRYHEESLETPLVNNFVRSVWKDSQGVLWVGTRAGLNRLDRTARTTKLYRRLANAPSSLSDDEVRSVLVARDGSLWVGTATGGLNRDRARSGVFEHFVRRPGDPHSLTDNGVNAILEDREGLVWIATPTGGLNRFDPRTERFASFRHDPANPRSIASDKTTALLEDSRGMLWVATEDRGLQRFDRESGRFETANIGIGSPVTILSLAEDPLTPGVLWIATLRHGLIIHDSSSGANQHLHTRNSILPSDTVYSVLSDRAESIWAGTNSGLVAISGRYRTIRTFGLNQGLQSMEFNTRAAFAAPDGEIFLGGVGGLNAFYPRNITQNDFPASVVVTQVLTMNRSRDSSREPYRTVFRQDRSSRRGQFSSGDRDLIFNYVALHFSNPARNTYRIRLDGFDSDWRDVGSSRQATYTNLPAGDYSFRVKAVTSQGVWSDEASYSFTIARPFYQTSWFLFAALASLLAVAYSLYQLRVRRHRAVQTALQSQVDARTSELREALSVIGKQSEELRESDALKSRFITNVSHDFRTPLSVTLGTLTDLQAGFYGPVSDSVAQELEVVIRNERRLLRLVNQLLAIARIESGKLPLQVEHCDLARLASDIVSSFQVLALRRQIRMESVTPLPVLVFCDPEWMEQTLSNVLLNALKFTPPSGRVLVSTGYDPNTNQPFVEILDNGPGIPQEELPRIFDRFYQTELGATTPHVGIGVGLSLVKEIVDLHGGEIRVQSGDAGTTFRIVLPVGNAHFEPGQFKVRAADKDRQLSQESRIAALVDDLLAENSLGSTPRTEADDAPTIVIAEDDAELCSYLGKHFRPGYRVLTASDGEAALQLVRDEVPDLVISDIMMPGMNGNELCRSIRSSPETDFIPVILLTARASVDQKLEGLDCGADDYVVKPFEIAELKARVRNALDSRKRLQSRLASALAAAGGQASEVLESADTVFVRRVYDAIRLNIQDEGFTVEQLARSLAMSRMHLFRRLRAVLGKAPAELLMEYRLERASELLAARTGTVSEIAYAVGFKSVSHFSRRFKDRFGCTPLQYSESRPGMRDPA